MDSGTDSTTTPAALPPEFPMSVQGGMLEALGINMYTTIGKCLVEFVANAFDGDARNVLITIPVEAIGEARGKLVNYSETELGRPLTVHGFLIGAMPDPQKPSDKQMLLLDKIKNAQPSTKWVVMGVRSLLERAYDTHLAVIKSLESDLDEDSENMTAVSGPAEQLLLAPAIAGKASVPALTLTDGAK